MSSPRLLLELVPSTSWGANLRSRLSRSEWDRLRFETYAKAGNRCEICGGRGRKNAVEAHERWEYDDETHVQKLVGIEALCPSCHSVRHLGRTMVVGHGPRAMSHLAKVNGWTPDETVQHVEEAFRTHANRSKFLWDLDLSWLSLRESDSELRLPDLSRVR